MHEPLPPCYCHKFGCRNARMWECRNVGLGVTDLVEVRAQVGGRYVADLVPVVHSVCSCRQAG